MNGSEDPPDDHTVHVHTHIGDVSGVIVEIRPDEHDVASGRDMDHLSDEDARDLYHQLAEWAKPHGYDTKTVRVHEPDQGRYVLVMMTRFNGEDALLGDHGYGDTYIQYQIISTNNEAGVCGTDPWSLARRYPGEWFPESNTARLMKDLDMETIVWSDLHDGMELTPEDIALFAERDDD